MAITTRHENPTIDFLVFRNRVGPWAIATATLIIVLITLYLSNHNHIITERECQSGELFFGLLAMNTLPRAIPGFIEMKLSPAGVIVRGGLYAHFYAWRDIVGNFTVTTKSPLCGINFLVRNSRSASKPYSKISLFDTYGHSPRLLADILNSYRQKFYKHSTVGATTNLVSVRGAETRDRP